MNELVIDGHMAHQLEQILLQIRTVSGLLALTGDQAPPEFAHVGKLLQEQAEAGLDLLDAHLDKEPA